MSQVLKKKDNMQYWISAMLVFISKNLSVCHKHKQHSDSRNFPFYLQPKGQRYSVNLSK